jgi:hypothetical protein
MNDIFKDLLDVCAVVYPDDILMYREPGKHVREAIRLSSSEFRLGILLRIRPASP